MKSEVDKAKAAKDREAKAQAKAEARAEREAKKKAYNTMRADYIDQYPDCKPRQYDALYSKSDTAFAEWRMQYESFDAEKEAATLKEMMAKEDKTKEAYGAARKAFGLYLVELKKRLGRGQMEEVCGIANLQKSRINVLIADATGAKSLEQVRKDNAIANRALRDRKAAERAEAAKALPHAAPETQLATSPPTQPEQPAGNNVDPDRSAASMKEAHAEPDDAEPTAHGSITVKAKAPASTSAEAFIEFKVAVDMWLPRMNDEDLQMA